MNEIPKCFYRISSVALVLNETRDKFLIIKDDKGWWGLPGGGLDWGTDPQDDIPREIEEEMSLDVIHVAKYPSYFFTNSKPRKSNLELSIWYAYIVYEVSLNNLDFSPSDECVAIDFVNIDSLPKEKVHNQVIDLAEAFDSKNHTPC